VSLKEDSIKSFLWKFLERFGSQAITLIVQIVMARILLPSDFGMLAIMVVFLNISNCFVQSGLNTALVQSKEVNSRDYSTVFLFSCGVALILFLLVFFFAPIIAGFYGLPQLIWPFRVMALSLLINSLYSVQTAKVTRDLELKKLFLSTLVASTISGVAGVFLAFQGFGIWALVAQQILFFMCACLVLQFQIKWKERLTFSPQRAKELFAYGWKLLVSSLLDQAYQGLYDLIIGKRYSDVDLGFFSQGKRFPQTIVSMFDGSLQAIALSTLSRLQDSKEDVKNVARIVMKTSMFVIAPTVVYLAVFASPLVILLLTEKWIGAIPFLQIACASYILWPVHTSNLQAINAIGRSDVFLKLEIAKVSVGTCLVILVIMLGGDIYALALCTVVSSVVAVLINAFPNKKLIGYSIKEQFFDFLPPIVLAVISGFIAFSLTLFGLNNVLILLLGFIAMVVVYLGLSWLLNRATLVYVCTSLIDVFKGKKPKEQENERNS